MTTLQRTSRVQTTAWVTVVVLGVLMLAAGLFILGQPVDAADFETETGIAWEDYQASLPGAADYLMREARLLGWSFAVLGGVATAIAATLLRRGDHAAWAIVWFLPIAYAGSAAVFYGSGGVGLGTFYATAAVAAVTVVVAGQRTAL